MNKNSFFRSSFNRRMLSLSAVPLFMFFFTVMGKTSVTKYMLMYNEVLFFKEDTNRCTRTNKINKNYCCLRLELISVRLTSIDKLHKFHLCVFRN